jgi:hypothetical protein
LNLVVAADVRAPFQRRDRDLTVRFVSLGGLVEALRSRRRLIVE